MNDNEKLFFVFNVTEGDVLYRQPLSQPHALGLIRFFCQAFEYDGVYVARLGKRIKPRDVVFKLIDADSEEGQRLAKEQVRCA